MDANTEVPLNYLNELPACIRYVRGWSEKFSASAIDGNNIGKIFPPKLVHLS